MKKFTVFFLLFCFFGFSQEQYTFDHISIYKGYNGFMNNNYKLITFGNSKDHSYNFEIALNANDSVISVVLRLESIEKYVVFINEPFPFKDFNSEIHLKYSQKKKKYSNGSECKLLFNKNETINVDDSSKKTTFCIYKNKKKTKIIRKIEINSFQSEVKNQKFNFVHSNAFLKCNNIDFLPNAIKSYKLFEGEKLLESLELEELSATNFSIIYKE